MITEQSVTQHTMHPAVPYFALFSFLFSMCKNESHPDLVQHCGISEEEVWGLKVPSGAPVKGPITTHAQLLRVLTTIGFTASGHHAAVNFGQYDYAGLVLNFPTVITQRMPEPRTAMYEVRSKCSPAV